MIATIIDYDVRTSIAKPDHTYVSVKLLDDNNEEIFINFSFRAWALWEKFCKLIHADAELAPMIGMIGKIVSVDFKEECFTGRTFKRYFVVGV